MVLSTFDGSEFGINLIGHVSGNLGLGVLARNTVSLLAEKGIPFSIYDLDSGLGRAGHDMRFRPHFVAKPSDLPHPINLFVLTPRTLAQVLVEEFSSILGSGRMNAALSPWELPTLARPWVRALELMDVLVAFSGFVQSTFESQLPGSRILRADHPLQLPANIIPDRARCGLPPDGTAFVTSFEPASDPIRKNPLGCIDAFLRGVGDNTSAHLIVKINNPKSMNREHAALRRIRSFASSHPRIQVIEESRTYEEVLRLYASCDAYVSLHRAEGLGLSLMESMALGKPVVATAWSGNTSFMDHSNSCLVSYRLVPADGSIGHYRRGKLGRGARWAEPDVEEAAAWMRELARSPELRARIGRRAANDMLRYRAEALRGSYLDELRELWACRSFLPRPPAANTAAVSRLERKNRGARRGPARLVRKALERLRR